MMITSKSGRDMMSRASVQVNSAMRFGSASFKAWAIALGSTSHRATSRTSFRPASRLTWPRPMMPKSIITMRIASFTPAGAARAAVDRADVARPALATTVEVFKNERRVSVSMRASGDGYSCGIRLARKSRHNNGPLRPGFSRTARVCRRLVLVCANGFRSGRHSPASRWRRRKIVSPNPRALMITLAMPNPVGR